MKKKHLTLGKKTLSVFLAVLMLMTCWVWIAPTEAEAVSTDVSSVTSYASYHVKLTVQFTNIGKSGNIKILYYPVNADGSLNTDSPQEYILVNSAKQYSSTTYTFDTADDSTRALASDNSFASGGYDSDAENGPVNGWPYGVELSSVSSWGSSTLALKSMYIGGVKVVQDGTWSAGSGNTKTVLYTYKNDSGYVGYLDNWNVPSWTISTSPSSVNLQVPSYGTRTSSAVSATLKDQYGVSLPGSSISYSINGTGATLSSLSGSSTAVSVTNAALANFTDATGTKNLTLTATGAGKTSTSTITLNAPKKEILYENIFSLSDWYYSDSSRYSSSWVTTDLTAGTIKIYKDTSVDEYTTNSSYPNKHGANMYSMPITGGEDYTVAFTTSNSTNGNKISEVFLFWYDVNGDPVNNTANSSTFNNQRFTGDGKHTVTFTAPQNATQAEIRFDNDTDDYSNLTISDIAVYPAERAEEIDLENWTARPVREVYTYNAASAATLATPARIGYKFSGWTNADGSAYSAAAMKDNKTVYSTWEAVPYDIGYNNLFSVADWGQAVGSAKTNQNGAITVDTQAGTIAIQNPSTAASNDNNYVPWTYAVPVDAGTEYIFEYDTNISTGTGTQIHIFYKTSADATSYTGFPNSPYVRQDGYTTGHTITFTPPEGTTHVSFRFGTTDGSDITNTFSNIGLYKKADYDNYAKNYEKIRVPFYYGDTTELSYAPTRDGYVFNGWQKADGTPITSVEGLSASETVYATWTKLWTVTFQNYDGTFISSAQVKDGQALATNQYPVQTPTRESDDDGAYTFERWYGIPDTVTADVTIFPVFTKTEHTVAYKSNSEATCEKNAMVDKYCSVCGYYFYTNQEYTGTEIAEYLKLGHSYVESDILDNSSTGNTDADTHEIKCIRYRACGSTKAVPHTWAEGETEGANCITAGTIHWTCPCTATKTTAGQTAPNVHENTKTINAKDATCTEKGYTGDTYCNNCNKTVKTGSEIAALGHTWTNTKTNSVSAADCLNDAVYYQECSVCHISAEDDTTGTGTTWTDTGSKLGHTWTDTEKFLKSAANCTDDAVYYQECSVCHISAEDDTTSTGTTWTKANSKWNHKFDGEYVTNNNGKHVQKCTNTGCTETGNEQNCTYGDWTTDNSATHSHTCQYCKYTPAAENHDWTSWTSTDATGTDKGDMTRSCNVCGRVETKDCTYKEAYTAATCTTDAYTTYTCSDCGHGYTVTDNDTAIGHKYTGTYKYDETNDKHQQLCANNCGTYGVGTTADVWADCSWTYKNIADGKHTATCVCGNSEEQACEGGEATCTAKAVCDKCNTEYGTTTDHSFKGTAVVLDGDKHAFLCEYCGDTTGYYGIGTNKDYSVACSGGTATCSAKAECTVCGDPHGELDANAHKWGAVVADADNAGKHIYTCEYNNNHTKSEDCYAGMPGVEPPTCEEDGYTLHVCEECSYTWETDPVNALDHEWGAWTSDDKGGHTRTCERAGCVYGENGAAKTETGTCADNATADVTDPTCTEEGYTTYICNDCGYVWTDDEVPSNGHTFTKEIETDAYLKDEATCTEDAVYYYACSVCGVSSKDETNVTWTKADSALDHDFIEVVDEDYLKSEATCTTVAVYKKSCSRCDVISDETFESGSVLGHNWTDTKTYVHTVSDCITDAVYYKECSRCNISSEGETDEIWTDLDSKSGHKFESEASHTAYLAPTCEDQGNVEYYTCDLCGKIFSDEGITEITKTVIDKLGHDWEDVAYKAPTCEEAGYTLHKECVRCDATLNKTEYKATGHNFTGAWTYDAVNNYHSKFCVNENCLADGEKANGLVVDDKQVKYTVEYDGLDYVITGGEKCTFAGEYVNETDESGVHSHVLKCECGNETSEVCVDADPETVDPTCTEDGYTLHICDTCAYEWKTDIEGALNHELADTATPNGDGTHSVKCSRCDYASDAEKCSGGTATCKDKAICEVCGTAYGETTDHTYDENKWEYQNDATCTEDGTEKNSCTVCGEEATRTAEDSATGHSVITEYTYDISGWTNKPADFDEEIKAPTCNDEGCAIIYCTKCDYYKTKTVKADSSAHVWEKDENGEYVWVAGNGGNCVTGITLTNSCTVCGKKQTKTEAVEHSWEITIEVAPTCVNSGCVERKCKVCYTTEEIFYDENSEDIYDLAPTGEHKYGDAVQVEPTCTSKGYLKEVCLVCGYENRTENEDMLEHDTYVVSAKAPTCETAGYYEYTKCSDCSYTEGFEAIPATGHDDNGKGKCDNCGGVLYEDGDETKGCNCICHKESWFMRIIYKILNFFWKLFKISKSCNCGNVHW